MFKILISFTGLIFFMGCAIGRPSKDEVDADFKRRISDTQDHYADCVKAKAQKYAQSVELPSEISVAATSACGPELEAYRTGAFEHMNFAMGFDSNPDARRIANQQSEALKRRLQEIVVEMVVDIRSEKQNR